MIATHYSTGTGTTGANMFGRPRREKNSPRATQEIIFLHGLATNEASWQGVASDHSTLTLQYLSQDSIGNRFMSVATGTKWGNDTIQTTISDAWTHAQANYGFENRRVHLIGISMGATCALNWAKTNPNSVASLSLVIPAIDIQDIDDNNRLPNLNPNIGYGGTGGFPAGGFRPPDDHTPARNASSYVPIASRIKIWYSNNDTICLPTLAQTFITAAGCLSENMGDQAANVPVGHAAFTLDPSQIAAHIARNSSDLIMGTSQPQRVHNAGRGQ